MLLQSRASVDNYRTSAMTGVGSVAFSLAEAGSGIGTCFHLARSLI